MNGLAVGDSRTEVVIEEITPTHLVRYAGASGDFNPLHHDDDYAREHGYPGLFGHGMFTMGLTGKILTGWFGTAALKEFGVRFTRQVWPGDTLTATAVVTGVDGGSATLDVETRNQNGEVVVAGDAVVSLQPDKPTLQ